MSLLGWAIVAFMIAVIAGALGFTGVARGAGAIAKLLFGLFLVIAIVFLVLFMFGIHLVL